MGFYYGAVVFYGITFEEKEFARCLRKFYKGVENKNLYLPEGGNERNAAYIEWINRDWAQKNDPVRLSQNTSEFGKYSCLCIAETLHGVGGARACYVFNDFLMPSLDTSRWAQQLQIICNEFKLPWESPTFQVYAFSLEAGAGAGFFYGMRIRERAILKSKIIEMSILDQRTYTIRYRNDPWSLYHDKIDPERLIDLQNDQWQAQDVPVRIYFAEEEGRRYYFLEIPTSWRGRGEFELEGVDTTPWNRHLHAKCERYGIAWKKPAFHLYLGGS